jgi:putative flippase GtrA
MALSRTTLGQLARFGAIGVVSTLAYIALYALLREVLPATGANAIALVVTALANTAANRRITFGVRGTERMLRDQLAGLAAFGIALAITTGSIELLHGLAPAASRAVEIAVLVVANAVATAVRFLVLRGSITRAPALLRPSARAG